MVRREALGGMGVKKTDKVWTVVFIFLILRVFLQTKKIIFLTKT